MSLAGVSHCQRHGYEPLHPALPLPTVNFVELARVVGDEKPPHHPYGWSETSRWGSAAQVLSLAPLTRRAGP